MSRVVVVFAQPNRLSKGEEADIVTEGDAAEVAHGVADALQSKGYGASCMAVSDDASGLITQWAQAKPDVVFNLAETVLGESSLEYFVPSLLDFLDIPYTGCDPVAINLCLDKARTKDVLAACGIPTPAWRVAEDSGTGSWDLGFPVIVKPLREDGSLGIHEHSVVREHSKLAPPIAFVLERYRQPALVETYVEGREFNVAILGNDPPVALPPCEIDYSSMPEGLPRIVGFKAKWFPETPEYRGSMPVCPAPIGGDLLSQVENIALAAYRACGLRDYGRIDLRWDGKNPPMVIDVNPNPAIGSDAGFVLSARKAGMGYGDLVQRIVRLAEKRREISPARCR